MSITTPAISSNLFKEILQDNKLMRTGALQIFKAVYESHKHEATATEIAETLNYIDQRAVVSKIVGLGKQIVKKYSIERRIRDNGTAVNWDLFFTGYQRESFFVWRLRPELINALEKLSLVKATVKVTIKNSYLFAWNPDKWKWENLEKDIEELNIKGTKTLVWSCKSYKNIRIGDRAFLVKLGNGQKGIIASGFIASEPFLSPHWSGEDKDVHRVFIEFDIILNSNKESVLNLNLLKTGNLTKQLWTPQSSGISIKSDCVEELEATWFDFLTSKNRSVNEFIDSTIKSQIFIEGASNQILQTRYERNPYARTVCLEHYGLSCSVCNFNFKDKYGNLGDNFIHVHHLKQLSTNVGATRTDPIQDLRPVCPNCHAMLHKRNPALTIEELKALLKINNDLPQTV